MSQAFENKSEGLSAALQVAKTTLADHVAMLKERTALADTAKPKLQDKLSGLHAEFDSYRHESKKKLDDMTAFSNKPQTGLSQSGKERIQY